LSLILKRMKVPAELTGRADRVAQKLTGFSRAQLCGLFEQGCVSVNGRPCTASGTAVARGDVVEAHYDPHRRYHAKGRPWEDEAFRIVFEDRYLLVVDKAAGVLTVPAHPGETQTLVYALARYFTHRGYKGRPQLVHRLDRDASGLLVFGKDRAMAEALQSQFELHKPEREYAALVAGVPPAQGAFSSYLASSEDLRQYSTRNPDEGQLAITHYRVKQVLRGAAWVRVWLETGRRNQIRVQFAEAGHPLLGDRRYGSDRARHEIGRAHV
jgi:23S rRNA pseudouridine1911/1915/1917 synthase